MITTCQTRYLALRIPPNKGVLLADAIEWEPEQDDIFVGGNG